MSTYAIAHLRKINMGPDIVEYLRRIDATLEPFDGRFVVHGAEVELLEGAWPGGIVVIAFPDREQARGWYDSAAYQAILPLRTRNSEGDVIFVDTVPPDHRSTELIPR